MMGILSRAAVGSGNEYLGGGGILKSMGPAVCEGTSGGLIAKSTPLAAGDDSLVVNDGDGEEIAPACDRLATACGVAWACGAVIVR